APSDGNAPGPLAPARCAAASAGWAALDSDAPAPNVAASLQSPCSLQHDVPALYFVSNATGSGARVRIDIALPPNGSHPASVLSAFWVGMWVSGLPCSYDGAAYLTVELLPPYATQEGVPPSPSWTVRAPVWDLVPAGSCDPQCQNDTAFFTVSGRNYCEDDAVTSGMGALGVTEGAFSPGDALSVVLNGTVGGPAPLDVTINDTTHPAQDLSWQYPGTTGLVGAGALTPLYSSASATNGGWTGGLDIGFGWQNCPVPASGTSFATACNSYDGPLANSTGSPAVDSVLSWNATAKAYTNRYPGVVTQSSSGACSGAGGAAPCADFTTYGGTGAYPTFQIGARLGVSWFDYGGASPYEQGDFGGDANEFPARGNLSALSGTTVLSAPATAVSSTAVTVTVRASDPNGVDRVTVSSYWCTTNATRSLFTYPATLSATPQNSSFDGNWSVNVPIGAAGMTGPFYYSVAARSVTGVATPAESGSVSLTSGAGGSCSSHDPSAPGLDSSDVTSVGGGYLIRWNESGASGVSNFTVDAHPTLGGTTTAFPVGNVTSARLSGLSGNASYDLSVVATNPAGLSTTSGAVTAGSTALVLLGRSTNFTASPGWANATTLRVASNATGGLPPYTFTFSFGDGTSESVFTSSAEASAVHEYENNYTGDAVVSVRIVDRVGDTASAPTVLVPVRGTPGSVSASMAGGDDFVHVFWSAPSAAPVNASAFGVTRYVVLWTTNATLAPYLSAGWPSNESARSIQQSVAGPGATGTTVVVPDGTEVFAQAFALDKYGVGLLPAETTPGVEPYLVATAAPLLAGPIGTDPGVGGPAPFTENFSTPLTAGTGTVVSNASYHFTGGTSLVATVVDAAGTFWANATYTFDSPGLVSVYLYATDSLEQLAVASTTVLVTPGASPVVAVALAPTPVWVNSSVTFTASASGGSGHYAFNWSLGDGSNATGANVTYSYTSAGTYIVSVVATDSEFGGTSTRTLPVTVLPIPTVAIVVTANGTAGTYRFEALVSGGYGNLSYTWVFDDGTQGVGALVSHTWTTPGTYTVSLEVTDGYGHRATATAIVVFGGVSPSTPAVAGGVAGWVVDALLVAVVALAVVCVVLLLRRRVPAPAAPSEPLYGDPEGPGSAAPVRETEYAEDPPRAY
ncbi:MAG: PKD domain-containing protein, partial [Thermoplasmata archaeon]